VYLSLEVSRDGAAYHALGRGLAAGGGCPELSYLCINGLKTALDQITLDPSPIVPTVRKLSIGGDCSEEESLLLCCGLVRMGCKHKLYAYSTPELANPRDSVQRLYECMVQRLQEQERSRLP
jgi:hypothetical protein